MQYLLSRVSFIYHVFYSSIIILVPELYLVSAIIIIISHISHTVIQQVKPIGSSFIGTSPEFELALYTILYFCSTDSHTDVTIAGQDVVLACFKMGRHGLGTCHPKLPKD